MVDTGDLKSPASRRAGSSPASGTQFWCSSMVERVILNHLVAGSIPAIRAKLKCFSDKIIRIFKFDKAVKLFFKSMKKVEKRS